MATRSQTAQELWIGPKILPLPGSPSGNYTPAAMFSTPAIRRTPFQRFAAACAACVVWLLLLACLAGCVRRRMPIRTNPPGAVVYVDDYEIGATPVSTNFVHYGTRRIRIAKDGYETLTVEQPIPAPWYQVPPLDFFAETVLPVEIRDQRTLNYQLVPQRVVPPDQLRGRAEDLRARANLAGRAVTASPPASGPTVHAPGATPLQTPAPPAAWPAPPSTGSPSVYPPQGASSGAPTLPPGILPPSGAGGDAGPQTLPSGGMPLRSAGT